MTETANPQVQTAAPAETAPAYREPGGHKIKRLWLASFLGAVAAVLVVALTALVLAVIASLIGNLLFGQNGNLLEGSSGAQSPFWMGMVGATFAALFNWYFFYIIIPVTTLVLRFSLGRFPKRGIARPGPYLRWGVIWGAILVLLPSLFAGYFMGSVRGFPIEDRLPESVRLVQSLLGGGLMGLFIGGISGLAVGGLFLLIVKPAKQIRLDNPAAEF